ncbi:MAG: hypothetical protein MHM6MM_008774 [Cercozoa sp. M6MM]
MALILTGRNFTAQEAVEMGLALKTVPKEKLLNEAKALAHEVAAMSKPVLRMAKEAVLGAYEGPLTQQMQLERRLWHSTFALADQKEGMQAFVNKRRPEWQHK